MFLKQTIGILLLTGLTSSYLKMLKILFVQKLKTSPQHLDQDMEKK